MADGIITQVRSAIGTKPKTRGALRTLGLGRIGATTTRKHDEALAGQIRLIEHLVEITAK